MGALVDISLKQASFQKVIKDFERVASKKNLEIAITKAGKRAADAGATLIKRELAAVTTLKPGKIGKSVQKYVHGNPQNAAIGVKISDTVRPLSDFKFTPEKPKYKTAPTIEIYKGQKKKLSQVFVAQMPTQHIGIFEREKDEFGKDVKRKNKDRRGNIIESSEEHNHIFEPTGPAITGIFTANEQVHQAVWDKIWETFEERVEHELKRMLNLK